VPPDEVKAADAERRSRLTPERQGELFGAVVELLREVGYEALTMDAVAARARISKATLYRQWQGKPRLVIHAISTLRPMYPDVDTGSLAGDLYAVAAHMADVAGEDAPLLASMSHSVIANPELGEMLREVVIRPERASFEALVQRAVDRGELGSLPAAVEFCVPILVQAVLNRPLCDGIDADEAHLLGIVDHVILPALRHS
jgi:AcrR family transcriptional regulator